MGQNALDQSDRSIFKLTISLEQNDERTSFLHVDTWKVEVEQEILGGRG